KGTRTWLGDLLDTRTAPLQVLRVRTAWDCTVGTHMMSIMLSECGNGTRRGQCSECPTCSKGESVVAFALRRGLHNSGTTLIWFGTSLSRYGSGEYNVQSSR